MKSAWLLPGASLAARSENRYFHEINRAGGGAFRKRVEGGTMMGVYMNETHLSGITGPA